jgi:endonuclease/exonuclease/phosphatase family metal-dependent hydrolase
MVTAGSFAMQGHDIAAHRRRRLKVLTYNIHSCRGADGRTDPARIAEVIDACAPDIVALQEVDVGRPRSGGVDQAKAIAAHLRMDAHFHPALHLHEEQYGDAILTPLPSRLVKAGPLPSLGETRGAIWAAIDLGGTELHVVNTHLGLRRRERMMQVSTLLGPAWLRHPDICDGPAVLLGDFNAVPGSLAYRTLARFWADARSAVGQRGRTFPSRFPILSLDHLFIRPRVIPISADVHSDIKARRASDHLPFSLTLDVIL